MLELKPKLQSVLKLYWSVCVESETVFEMYVFEPHIKITHRSYRTIAQSAQTVGVLDQNQKRMKFVKKKDSTIYHSFCKIIIASCCYRICFWSQPKISHPKIPVSSTKCPNMVVWRWANFQLCIMMQSHWGERLGGAIMILFYIFKVFWSIVKLFFLNFNFFFACLKFVLKLCGEMCLLKLYLSCVCRNCSWNACVETHLKLEMCVRHISKHVCDNSKSQNQLKITKTTPNTHCKRFGGMESAIYTQIGMDTQGEGDELQCNQRLHVINVCLRKSDDGSTDANIAEKWKEAKDARLCQMQMLVEFILKSCAEAEQEEEDWRKVNSNDSDGEDDGVLQRGNCRFNGVPKGLTKCFFGDYNRRLNDEKNTSKPNNDTDPNHKNSFQNMTNTRKNSENYLQDNFKFKWPILIGGNFNIDSLDHVSGQSNLQKAKNYIDPKTDPYHPTDCEETPGGHSNSHKNVWGSHEYMESVHFLDLLRSAWFDVGFTLHGEFFFWNFFSKICVEVFGQFPHTRFMWEKVFFSKFVLDFSVSFHICVSRDRKFCLFQSVSKFSVSFQIFISRDRKFKKKTKKINKNIKFYSKKIKESIW